MTSSESMSRARFVRLSAALGLASPALTLTASLQSQPAFADTVFTVEASETPAKSAIDLDAIEESRADAWDAYRESRLSDEQLLEETSAMAMTFGEATMRYSVQVIGDKPENGYPLYIAMHGGGSDDTPDFNDSQWEEMKEYYSDELECGVYVAVRGVRDTWDTHFNPESYPLYDRLISYMILTEDVDPNRVYLEGFSAGGDGVYAISTRMSDRFAAANMSSGHPNGVKLYNLYHVPIQLQAGEFDTAFDRNTVTAEYGLMLDELQAEYGGFEHRTLIHYDCGHNYEDSSRDPIPVMADVEAWLKQNDRTYVEVDSFPPDYMDAFVRDPLPQNVIWDLSTRAESRATESFYYLHAPYSTNSGMLNVSYDRENNCIDVVTQEVEGDFDILLNEQMVDFSLPVTVTIDGVESTVSLVPDMAFLEMTTADRGDPNYQFLAYISCKQIEV